MEQMQHLHGASSGSPLPLPSLSCLLLWSDAAVPAPKAAHGSTVVCRAGARRGEWEDGCNPRQFRDTCVFLGGHGTAPLGGTEPSALGYRNSRLSAARRPPGSSWRSRGGVLFRLGPLCTIHLGSGAEGSCDATAGTATATSSKREKATGLCAHA